MFKPRVKIDFQTERYQVKTASSWSEFFSVLRLRYQVFFLEFAGTKSRKKIIPLDFDRHDLRFDHLIVKDKKNNKVVASYRLMAANHKNSRNSFYTEGEFQLDEFLQLPGNKVELGRASVHKDYRKGTVVILLWQGLYEYVQKTNARYLFGCSSISRSHFHRIAAIKFQMGERNSIDLVLKVPVRSSFALSSFPDFAIEDKKDEEEKSLPSLMVMYSLAGAKFGDNLAYDQEMDCVDIFTYLDFHHLPKAFEQKLSRKK